VNPTGTGWPEPESDGYTIHANTKLNSEQKKAIDQSGEPESQWIREAIQERLDREAVTATTRVDEAATRKMLREKTKVRMEEIISSRVDKTTDAR
jgi:hypothetical protein